MRRTTAAGRATVSRILTHFVQHPEACADVEGVARWQLIEEDVRYRLEETQRILDALVARGLLERLAPEATAPLYRLNVDRQREAERLSQERQRSRTRPAGPVVRRRKR